MFPPLLLVLGHLTGALAAEPPPWKEEARPLAVHDAEVDLTARNVAMGALQPAWPAWAARALPPGFPILLAAAPLTTGTLALGALLAGVVMGAGTAGGVLWLNSQDASGPGAWTVALGSALLGSAVAILWLLLSLPTAFMVGEWAQVFLVDRLGAPPRAAAAPGVWPRDRTRELVSAAVRGAWRRQRWREALPLVGPALALQASVEPVITQADAARRLAGVSRTYDRLATHSRRWLAVRALVITAVWLVAPLVPVALCGAGLTLLLPGRTPLADAPSWVPLALSWGWLGAAAGATLLGVLLGGVGLVLEVIIPQQLAGESAGQDAPLPKRTLGNLR